MFSLHIFIINVANINLLYILIPFWGIWFLADISVHTLKQVFHINTLIGKVSGGPFLPGEGKSLS